MNRSSELMCGMYFYVCTNQTSTVRFFDLIDLNLCSPDTTSNPPEITEIEPKIYLVMCTSKLRFFDLSDAPKMFTGQALRQVDTIDPRAGRKCGEYSNRSNVSDSVCQVKNRSKYGRLQYYAIVLY
jgi:hypothetical protein